MTEIQRDFKMESKRERERERERVREREREKEIGGYKERNRETGRRRANCCCP